MAIDSTFDFEKRRNRPIKYNRDLVNKTVQVLKKVEAIKQIRQRRFWENRHRVARIEEKVRARREILRSIDLVAPAASRQRAAVNLVARKAAEGLERHQAKTSNAMEEA